MMSNKMMLLALLLLSSCAPVPVAQVASLPVYQRITVRYPTDEGSAVVQGVISNVQYGNEIVTVSAAHLFAQYEASAYTVLRQRGDLIVLSRCADSAVLPLGEWRSGAECTVAGMPGLLLREGYIWCPGVGVGDSGAPVVLEGAVVGVLSSLVADDERSTGLCIVEVL